VPICRREERIAHHALGPRAAVVEQGCTPPNSQHAELKSGRKFSLDIPTLSFNGARRSEKTPPCRATGLRQEIIATLEQGEVVKLSAFGSFAVRQKRPRVGRDPRNGQPWPISARRVVVFRASPVLRTQIQLAVASS
jgi:nucleoid DNA-binding protein